MLKPASTTIGSVIFSALALCSALGPFYPVHAQNSVISTIESVSSSSVNHPGLGNGGIIGRCDVRGSVHVVNESQWTGEVDIPPGETYVIANKTLPFLGSVYVDGGTLIVRNATLTRPSGGGSDMWLWNAGCVELTNTLIINGGQLWVGCGGSKTTNGCGASCCEAPDNSTVFVNGSTSEMAMPTIGSYLTIKIEDSIWGNGLGVGTPGTKLDISDSLVLGIGLSFYYGLTGPVEISGLHPGHFDTWDLRRDLSLPTLPYDLTLTNSTVIPNTVGPGPLGRYLGWSIGIGQGNPYSFSGACPWPKVTIRNSELSDLGLGFQYNPQWCTYNQPVVFSGIPSTSPQNTTYFDSISIINSTFSGELSITERNLNMTFINVPALQIYPYYTGKSHLDLINTTIVDGGFTGCECTVSAENSRVGAAHGGWEMISKVPYHDLLPLYDTDAASYGSGGIVDSTVTITGSIDLTRLNFARSTALRFFPVTVTDSNGAGVPNVKLSLSTPSDPARFWRTDGEGKVEIPVSYNDGDWTDSLVLTASAAGLSNSTDIYLRMASPIRLVLGAPDFNIVARSPVSFTAGQSATMTIRITLANGFTGNITLSDNLSPGLYCTNLTPATVTPGETATFSCTANTPGIYYATIMGIVGATIRTTVVTIMASEPPPSPPSWPSRSQVSAGTISATIVTLTWNSATIYIGLGSYEIYQNTTLIATIPPTTTTYSVGGLRPGTTYTFKVEACDGEGNCSTNGPSETIKTSSMPSQTPSSHPTFDVYPYAAVVLAMFLVGMAAFYMGKRRFALKNR